MAKIEFTELIPCCDFNNELVNIIDCFDEYAEEWCADCKNFEKKKDRVGADGILIIENHCCKNAYVKKEKKKINVRIYQIGDRDGIFSLRTKDRVYFCEELSVNGEILRLDE